MKLGKWVIGGAAAALFGVAQLAGAGEAPAAAAAATAAPAAAAAADPAKGPQSAEVQALQVLEAADKLALYGYEHRDPVALAQAARMKKGVPGGAALEAKRTGSDATGDKPVAARDLSVEGLLKAAKEMAPANPVVVALAQEVASMTTRGASGGPRSGRFRVNASTTDVFDVTFRGGEWGSVYVQGDGDTDLDLFIRDSDGRVACSDEDNTDVCLCEFWVPSTRNVRIEVKNYGRVWNEYVLRTN